MNGLNLLQQYIKEQELTGVILISPINLHYFAGFTGTTGFAIITQDKAFMITDFRYTEQATKQCEGYTVIQYETTVMDTLVDIFNEYHIHEGLFGIEGKQMPVDTYETLCDTLDECFNFTSINFAKLRAVKREDELDLLRKAAKIGDDAFAALLLQLKVGMTENEDEEKAYQEIRDTFNTDVVKLSICLNNMKFDTMNLNEDKQIAEMYYTYNEKTIAYFINMPYRDNSWGVDFEDPIEKEYTKKIEDCSIEVTIYKLKESKKSSCVAKFKYDNIEYLLTGTTTQEEFEKILKNLVFPK